jgi:ribonuclease R
MRERRFHGKAVCCLAPRAALCQDASMPSFRDAILAILSEAPGQALASREISARLDLDLGGRRALRRELRTLCQEGILRRTRGGRYLPGRPREEVEGVISFRSRGSAELELDSGETWPVPASYLHGALPGDRVRAELLPLRRGFRPAAEVREVTRPGPGQILGTLRRAGRGAFVEPRDPDLFPYYLAVPREAMGDAEEGDFVLVQLTAPVAGGVRVIGKVVATLGREGEPGAEVAAIAVHHGLRFTFSEAAASEARAVASRVTEEDARGRLDLRAVPFVTIDGEDARDFDDAIAVERREGGGFRLRVAIADVSHYVLEGSGLDREAAERGTSVYFPDRVLPMLPPEISSGICCLKPDEDRLALCADLEISPSGEVLRTEFAEALIHSHARLTYTEVQAAIQAARPVRGVGDPAPMVDLCEILARRRRERGSLDLEIPEAQVVLDGEGEAADVARRERLLAHRIIEELMIITNEAVARIFEARGEPTVFRVHGEPDPQKLRNLAELAVALGLPLGTENLSQPLGLARMAESLRGHPGARALHALLLRSLPQALYDVENIGHFGLATNEYLHFTSPIRRYPDLVVHRLLRRLLRTGACGAREKLTERLAELATQASARERAALEAEREVLAYYRARLMSRHLGEVFPGTVAGIVPFGLFVAIDRPFVEGLVHVQTLGDDYYAYDEQAQVLRGRRTGRAYRIGDPVQVRVRDVSLSRRQVDFELERPPGGPQPRWNQGRLRERRGRPWSA